LKEWPVCLTCRVVAVRGILHLPDDEQKTTGINKKAPVVALPVWKSQLFPSTESCWREHGHNIGQ